MEISKGYTKNKKSSVSLLVKKYKYYGKYQLVRFDIWIYEGGL
jgi:hypothetical protein